MIQEKIHRIFIIESISNKKLKGAISFTDIIDELYLQYQQQPTTK